MIAIIDYDAGNLKSVEKAFLALGEECVVTRDHDSIRRADRVVLPGVGSFGTAMQQLKKYELDQVIREVVHYQRFGEALRLTTDRLDCKNFYAFNPGFDK